MENDAKLQLLAKHSVKFKNDNIFPAFQVLE